jgi:hypothetical protein
VSRDSISQSSAVFLSLVWPGIGESPPVSCCSRFVSSPVFLSLVWPGIGESPSVSLAQRLCPLLRSCPWYGQEEESLLMCPVALVCVLYPVPVAWPRRRGLIVRTTYVFGLYPFQCFRRSSNRIVFPRGWGEHTVCTVHTTHVQYVL